MGVEANVKRFFASPQPLAFFGFLLTFLLTVAWRVPLQAPHLFGTAEAAPTPVVPIPVPVEPVPVAVPIPQPLPAVLGVPPAAMVLAPAPTTPSFAGSAPPAPAAEPNDAMRGSATAKKKIRHAHKAKVAVPTGDDGVANLLSAATEGKTTKKRGRRD